MTELIETNKILKKPWTKQHEKTYTWLYNYMNDKYEDVDEFTFIDDFKRHLYKIINENNNWKDTSKEALYFMIARYLHNFGNKRYSKLYSQYGHDLTVKNQKKESENQQDEKEIENYRPHEYFVNIINEVNLQDIQTITKHYEYLILNLLTLQPPLRTSFYTTAKFLTKKADNNGEDNYIYINRRGKLKVYYIVNKDKASNYKMYNIDKKLSKIQIENEELCQVIYDSYIKYPRTYLFELNNKPITQHTLLSYLRRITKVSEINIDMMRSSYVNWFYENNHTLYEKDKLSKQMRHSVITAMKNYYKDSTLSSSEKDDRIKQLEEENNELKRKNEELMEKLKQFENVDVNSKAYTKNRRDALYNLNVRKQKPREETLNKYNIKLENGIYV